MFDISTPITDPECRNEIDFDRLQDYIDGLIQEFQGSSEFASFEELYDSPVDWAATYLRYAASYCGVTPATMTALDSAEVLFDLFPRKVSTVPVAAYEIIAEIAAFWSFLNRTRDLEHGEAISESLIDEAAEQLEDKLGDPSNFDMAKTMYMSAAERGYDLNTEEGRESLAAEMTANIFKNDTENEAEANSANEQPAPRQLSSDTTIHHDSAHVGRNEPCPCGSGRKFKKCCRR